MLCAGSFTKQQETAEKYGGIICTRFWKQGNLRAISIRWYVEAPRVAKHCQPGQFVIVKSRRRWASAIPLTICDYDREAGYDHDRIPCRSEHRQRNLRSLRPEIPFRDFVGPLGYPSELCDRGKSGRDERRRRFCLLQAV